MKIVCQQTFLMKYHALFVIFEKKQQQNLNCRLLQIIGGALRVKFDSLELQYRLIQITFILPEKDWQILIPTLTYSYYPLYHRMIIIKLLY